MIKNAKELSQVKARQTKLGKKNSAELIQIILKKDKVERNLNKQVANLKGEVNTLSTRVNNFYADMQGTYQALEAAKDQVKALQEKNDALKIESKDNYDLYLQEGFKLTKVSTSAKLWKASFFVALGVTVVSIIIAVVF